LPPANNGVPDGWYPISPVQPNPLQQDGIAGAAAETLTLPTTKIPPDLADSSGETKNAIIVGLGEMEESSEEEEDLPGLKAQSSIVVSPEKPVETSEDSSSEEGYTLPVQKRTHRRGRRTAAEMLAALDGRVPWPELHRSLRPRGAHSQEAETTAAAQQTSHANQSIYGRHPKKAR
jgi:hypothetical protein